MLKFLKDLVIELCKLVDCNPVIQNYIIISILLFGIISILTSRLYAAAKFLVLRRNQKLLNKDLHPYFSPYDVDSLIRDFVPLNYQSFAPTEEAELRVKDKAPIIPFFLKKTSLKSRSNDKYFLILADTGMGKTTFLVNFYISYKILLGKPFSSLSFDIKLFPLGRKNVLHEIEKVNDKGNVILLLDAYDEDLDALEDFVTRLNVILEAVREFRMIIITCRTQFFPSQAQEPHDTPDRFFGEQGEIKFKKLYLSVFDNRDVKKFLRKRFSPIWQRGKFLTATEIISMSPSLAVRPMLLRNIEELVDSEHNFKYSFEVYAALIEKWIERESIKPGISKNLFSQSELFKEYLQTFSQKLAIYLYENRVEHGGYFLPAGKSFDYKSLDISELVTLKMNSSDRISRTKSLLNRDANDNYKFSHKSILEYFLALSLFNGSLNILDFNFSGMDATQKFLDELLHQKLMVWQKNDYLSISTKASTSGSYNQEYQVTNMRELSWTIEIKNRNFIDLNKFKYIPPNTEVNIGGSKEFKIVYLALLVWILEKGETELIDRIMIELSTAQMISSRNSLRNQSIVTLKNLKASLKFFLDRNDCKEVLNFLELVIANTPRESMPIERIKEAWTSIVGITYQENGVPYEERFTEMVRALDQFIPRFLTENHAGFWSTQNLFIKSITKYSIAYKFSLALR